LLQALASKLFEKKEYNKIIKNYIDFAMLGTVADCMSLT
jgi:single-stranded DNA-specific DHH superfamily exonuclease